MYLLHDGPSPKVEESICMTVLAHQRQKAVIWSYILERIATYKENSLKRLPVWPMYMPPAACENKQER